MEEGRRAPPEAAGDAATVTSVPSAPRTARATVDPPASGPSGGPAPSGFGPTQPGSLSNEALAAQQHEELARQEHLAHLLRFRGFMPRILAVWIAFAPVDWLVATYIEPGPVLPFVVLRAALALWIVLMIVRTHRPPLPGPREFRVLDLGTFIAGSAICSAMGFWYGGIATPYYAGVVLTLLVRGVIVAQPWRTGLWQFGVPALTYPAVFAVGALVSADVRAQFADPRALVTFVHNVCFVGAGLAFIVLGGHVTWSLRRQVFEARSIGRYRLRRRVGQGGMGEVWAAYDDTLKREVALKILRPERVNEEWLQRFHREAHATAELSHLHTVRIFDYGATDDGLWYYAMELLEGETLRQRVSREGGLPVALVQRFAAGVAGALAEAHARGIVHRDIKPENLFIAVVGGERDVIKLLDFGLAKTTRVDDGLTKTGWVGGTPGYMSPEVAAGRPADARSDVYSFGATLYFAIAGAPPFASPTLGALLRAHLTEVPPTPSTLVPGVPAALDRLIMRCLEKQPDDRYPDGAAVLAALAAADAQG